MRATFSPIGQPQAGGPIRGTFYPDAAKAGHSVPSAVPRILTVLAGVAFMRMLATMARHHGSHGGGRERRMERLARLHRDLHAREDGATKATEGATA